MKWNSLYISRNIYLAVGLCAGMLFASVGKRTGMHPAHLSPVSGRALP